MSVITINGVTFDPSLQQHVLSDKIISMPDASTSDYILIQTTQPLNRAQKNELHDRGVEILEYVPDDTYLCRYKRTDLTPIRSLPYITWANIYLQDFKIAPRLKFNDNTLTNKSMAEVVSHPVQSLSRTLKTVDIVFHKNTKGRSIRKEIADAAHVDAKDINVGTSKVRLTVQSKYLPDLAAIDGVRHIEEVTPYKLLNNIARGILKADTTIAGTIFQGDGQIVAIADTGFDRGSTTDVHPAFTGRVKKLYALGRTGNANDPEGHGTHVAGSVLGKDTLAPGIDIAGTAPKATLILQSVIGAGGGLTGIPTDLHKLFSAPYADDARIHTNSWGNTNSNGLYNSNCSDVDDFVWKNRDFIICFAAGNEGSAAGTVNPPGTAKNCITVGATENTRPDFPITYRNFGFPSEPVASDKVADNNEGMAAFSSRGPTNDHRIKPDVVAPGTCILSTLSRAVTNPAQDFGTSAYPGYFYDGGTSMATPLVAGCVAVVREFLNKSQNIQNPSAALVKAMLINGAYDIKGQYTPTESGSIPNMSEGFGRVNLETTIGPFKPNQLFILTDENTELDTGEQESININIPAGTRLLKVTLVWTDPAGDKLQNDLDLIVKASNGQEAHGNVDLLSPDFDRDNNVEQVVWPNVPAGNCSVIIKAFRIAREKQSYALVIRTEE